ncbi:MAG: glycosyl hydrolase [Bacteroidetes bacterium]|nr:MAG: glycosyl hydrolase [Bacteroidota bacterium]
MKRHIIVSMLLLLCIAARLPAQNWQHKGPFKDAAPGNLFRTGRADCIALDPGFDDATNKKMYVGSYSGGLWESSDAGVNWTSLSDGSPMTYHGVSALAVQPAGGVLYVADFNRYNSSGNTVVGNSAIYKYFPGSSTWTTTGVLPGVSGVVIVNHIKIHPSTSQIVFAATNQGLFRSINSGSSWSLVSAGAYENLDFMPRTGGSGAYPYFVYASGDKKFTVSSDDGATFSAVSCMTTLLTQYQVGYADMAYTASTINPGEHYIYLLVFQSDPGGVTADFPYSGVNNDAYAVYKFTYNSGTGTETCSDLMTYKEYHNTSDRMCIAANDNVVYFGGVSIFKFNTNYPTRMYRVNPSSVAELYYTFGSSVGYNVNGTHADQHDIVLRPDLQTIFNANDGGCYRLDYVPANTPDDGVYINTWTERNMGMHISQIWGFSGAEEDPDFYMTGEADNNGFYTDATTTTGFFGGETPGALVDKYDMDQRFYRGSSYSAAISHYNSGTITTQTSWNAASSSDECYYNPYSTLSGPFTINTIFQDPNRPEQFYYGSTGTLDHFCPSGNIFSMKLRYSLFFNNTTYPTDPIKWSSWYMVPKSMAFSKANKNKVYFCTTNSYDPTVGAINGPPQVFAYNSSDIDDSWIGHNENNWISITPDFLAGAFMTTVHPHIDTSAKVVYAGLAASDWDPDKIWLACTYVPLNPGIKVLKYESGVWTDYSTGIAAGDIPVSIVYEQGTNDQLYLGTNRNMYYRNNTMTAWALYDTGLPRVASVQMQINYTENTVRTGTYGRGVWYSDLKCPGSLDTLITGTISANAFVEMKNSITAQNLTISSGDVKFRAGNYVDLLPDFLVTANASTKFLAYIHNCDGPGHTLRKPQKEDMQLLDNPATAETRIDREMLGIYPNPNDGHFFLRKESEGKMKIEIYSSMGQLVYMKADMNESQLELDLSAQPDGVYLVRVISGDRMQTKRIIKQ